MARKSFQTSSKEPSQRQLRVSMEIRKILAEVFSRYEIPLPTDQAITVTQVKITPDFSLALAYVLPLSGDKTDETIAYLNKHKGYFRKRMGQNLSLRTTPNVKFVQDDSFDEAHKINNLLHLPQVKQDILKIDEEE